MERTVSKEYQVYLLSCADGTLYCGIAKNAEARLKAHNAGKGAKYTRSRLPVKIVYTETVTDKSTALKREIAIKRMPREQKLALIRGSVR